MDKAKYQVTVVWNNGEEEVFQAQSYEMLDTTLILTRQIQNQTSAFLAALTSEEKVGIPLSSMKYFKCQ